MHEEHAAVLDNPLIPPATISEMHARYKTVVENNNTRSAASPLPQTCRPTLTPADVDIQTELIKKSVGEATARRTAELAAMVSTAPDPDNSIAETFNPIMERAEQRAIHNMDNASNNKKRWMWGIAIISIVGGGFYLLGRRSKHNKE